MNTEINTGFFDGRIVFVGGAPRPGTTLVQRLLDGHTQIFAGPELNLFCSLAPIYEKMYNDIDSDRTTFYFSKGEFSRVFQQFIRSLFFKARNFKVVSEKSPSNVLVFNVIAEINPRALFFFVVRDPKDIISSYLTVKRNALKKGKDVPYENRNIFLSIDHVYAHFSAGYKFYEQNKERVKIVNYEDVINETERVAEEICKFMDLPFEKSMIELTGDANEYLIKRVSSNDSIYYSEDEVSRKVDSLSLGKWENFFGKYRGNFIDLVFREFNTNPVEKTIVGRMIYFIYKVHIHFNKKNTLVGKFYNKIISRVSF